MAGSDLGAGFIRHAAYGLCVFVASACVCACSNPQPDDNPCPRRSATFRVQLTASGGELPRDTTVEVAYGSNTETFDLRHHNGDNQDVCCRVVATPANTLESVSCDSASDAGAERQRAAIQCELNTNGAARLTVTASGYAVLEQTLAAERLEGGGYEHCDALATRDVFVELFRGDAGP
jgi:hypothetical protein